MNVFQYVDGSHERYPEDQFIIESLEVIIPIFPTFL